MLLPAIPLLVTFAEAGQATPTAPILTLAEAETQALRHQPALHQAQGQAEAAEGRVDEARAAYLPQVGLAATYERTTANVVPRPGFATSTATVSRGWGAPTVSFYNFTASGSQLLYDFNQTLDRMRAAGATRDAARLFTTATAAQVLLGVRRAYFQARANRELVDVAAKAVGNQERHVAQIRAFVEAGMRPDIDLAQVQTSLANTRVQLVAAQNAAAVALAQLNQAMGLPVGSGHVLTDSEISPVPGEEDDTAQLAARAEKSRPEIQVLQQQRRAQELTISALRGGYAPALSATAGASEIGSHLDNLVPNWFVGLNLSWPLLQGGLTRGQIREAKGTLTALDAGLDALRSSVHVEVEEARLGIVAAKAGLQAAEQALINGREQLRLAEGRYGQGLGSAIELGDAQVAFSGAEAQEVQARYAVATARAGLVAALGTEEAR